MIIALLRFGKTVRGRYIIFIKIFYDSYFRMIVHSSFFFSKFFNFFLIFYIKLKPAFLSRKLISPDISERNYLKDRWVKWNRIWKLRSCNYSLLSALTSWYVNYFNVIHIYISLFFVVLSILSTDLRRTCIEYVFSIIERRMYFFTVILLFWYFAKTSKQRYMVKICLHLTNDFAFL